jgi:DNA polymerase-3 subunit beta
MKFQADREVLGEAISFVVRLMSPKPQLPQLSGVMITAGNNEVILSIFDYEVSAKVSIAAAVDAPGKVSRSLLVRLSLLPFKSHDFN